MKKSVSYKRLDIIIAGITAMCLVTIVSSCASTSDLETTLGKTICEEKSGIEVKIYKKPEGIWIPTSTLSIWNVNIVTLQRYIR